MSTQATSSGHADIFQQEVTAVLRRIRSTLSAVVTAVPPAGSLAKAADLQRALKLDKKLSWKLAKVINASEPMAIGSHVPGPSNLAHFLRAAAARGVPKKLIDAASVAGEDFHRVVREHAGERSAFDTMIASLAGDAEAEQVILQHRRAVFRGQQHIFGVHVKTQVRMVMFQPAADPDLIDYAQVKGYIALHRTRLDMPLVFSHSVTMLSDGTACDIAREPIDPMEGDRHRTALMPAFCSRPLPEHRIMQPEPGVHCLELINNGVGQKAAITCVEGHVGRGGVPHFRYEGMDTCSACATVRVPCECLLLDVLVREGTFADSPPCVFTYADHQGPVSVAHEARPELRLRPAESVAHLGKGPSVMHTPDYPRMVELAQHIFDRLEWDGERFDVYRCRVEYPVLPSTLVMKFDLLAKPSD